MTARNEQKNLIENQIKDKLSLLPYYMSSFDLKMAEGSEINFRTRLQYISHVSEFIEWMELNKQYKLNNIDDLKQITSLDIMEWKRSLDYIEKEDGKLYPSNISATTICAKLSAIRKFFNLFYEELGKNPTLSIRNPKIDKDKDKDKVVISDNEFGSIFNNLHNGVGSNRAKEYQKNYIRRDMAIIYLLAGTGIRNDALVGINIEDVDLQNRTIKVNSKGDKTREKDLPDEAYYHLTEYLKERLQKKVDTNALFISNRNKRIDKKTVRNMIKKYSTGVDKRITPHVFRKTFGTRIYNESLDIILTSDLLDHDDMNTTRKHYIQVDKAKRRKVVRSANLVGYTQKG